MENAYTYQGDNYHHCIDCGLIIKFDDIVFRGKWGYRCYTCQYYFDMRKKTMSNIKITAEVDGKQVPLHTVSTETFEAIKALEKSKEIPVPVARLAVCSHIPRLLFRPTYDINLKTGMIYALDLRRGSMACSWKPDQDEHIVNSQYKEITTI